MIADAERRAEKIIEQAKADAQVEADKVRARAPRRRSSRRSAHAREPARTHGRSGRRCREDPAARSRRATAHAKLLADIEKDL